MNNIAKLLHHVNVICMNGHAKSPVNSDEIKFVINCVDPEGDGSRVVYYAEIINATDDEMGQVSVCWTTGRLEGKYEELLDGANTMMLAIAKLDERVGAYMVEIGI